MTKRPGTTPSTGVPHWAEESGCATAELERFFAFLKKKHYIVAENTLGCKPCALARPVAVAETKEYDADVACDHCCEHCECCNAACNELLPNDDEETAHDFLCERCLSRGWPACGHGMPETCPCCGEEVRVLYDLSRDPGYVGQFHKDRCIHCEDDVCEHQA